MSDPIEFFFTSISPTAAGRLAEVLSSARLSEGTRVRDFESALASHLGLRHPAALNSGTAALHLALAVAGVGSGDEVILPAQTFVATGLAVLYQEATPVFADVDPRTGNIDPESIRRKISPRTRAVMPVHWAGYPCDLDEINALADAHGLTVVEDAAHALGASYRSRPIGAISHFTAFSFQAIKHLTTGDGGALCARNEADAREVFRRRWFGIDRAQDKPDVLGERVYDLRDVGFKYHMNDLAAALGVANLDTFAQRLSRRQAIGARYRQGLTGIQGLELLRSESDRTHAYWLFTILVDRREAFIRKLADHGIPASVVHRRIDRNRVLGGVRDDLIGQAEFDARQVAVPVHEGLGDEDVERIMEVITSGW